MSKKLVIVESPAKARTIEKMLGKGFVIKASMGHVSDLPKSSLGVDIEHDFEPKYVVPRDKSQAVKDLKGAVASADEVYLATDPDREGEAIAWHLARVTDADHKIYKRVVFHEITPSAIENAFAHPKKLDLNLVNAQQARRILDRLVGYKISPLLWRKIRRGLSAGRVQSVAVKIIVDREREIDAFKPKEYWTIEAVFKKELGSDKSFKANFIGLTKGVRLELGDKASTEAVLAELREARYSVKKVQEKNQKKSPSPPFITSTLQQEAWRRFRFSAKKTMSIAQQLYEGLPLGNEGSTGLITYMRTDSTHVAKEALSEVREFIKLRYGSQNLPERTRIFMKKIKGAQEAHEAIRPTKIRREPDIVKPYLSTDQYRVYQLIWNRMVASQMADAVLKNTSVDIEARPLSNTNRYLFRASCSESIFQGYMGLYAEQRDDEEEKKSQSCLPPLELGEKLKLVTLNPEQNYTKPPPRFTEATLIRVLEQNGIGRPSTYASIISTIQDREYISRKAGALAPTELGGMVTDLLVNNFADIVNIDYTAKIEDELDKIARNEENWVKVVREFYSPLEQDLEKASENIEKLELAPEISEDICPQCNKERLLIKLGRYGKYMECPSCKFKQTFRIKTGVACPDCPEKGELVGRLNKKGKLFYGCNKFPAHKFAINFKPVKEPCPQCGGLLMETKRYFECYKCKHKFEAKKSGAAIKQSK